MNKMQSIKLLDKKFIVPFALLCLILIYIFVLRGNTPEKAMRNYVFLKGNPIEAFNLSIKQEDYIDKMYGRQYFVKGYFGNETGMEITFFYLKKDIIRGWYVTTAGTGP